MKLLTILLGFSLLAQTTNPAPIIVLHRADPKHRQVALSVSVSPKCMAFSRDGSAYAKAHHYATGGKMYGIMIHPKDLPGYPGVPHMVWLCRYHMAEMIGTDPETGEKPTWVK